MLIFKLQNVARSEPEDRIRDCFSVGGGGEITGSFLYKSHIDNGKYVNGFIRLSLCFVRSLLTPVDAKNSYSKKIEKNSKIVKAVFY